MVETKKYPQKRWVIALNGWEWRREGAIQPIQIMGETKQYVTTDKNVRMAKKTESHEVFVSFKGAHEALMSRMDSRLKIARKEVKELIVIRNKFKTKTEEEIQ